MALLEREKEVQGLTAALEIARTSLGRLVLVAGEAGIGKTALVDHFLRHHVAEADVLRGYCDPLMTPSALGPLHDICRGVGSDLAQQISDGVPIPVIFSRVLDRLMSATRPTILVIEDIHWADDATVDLLKYLARRLEGTCLLLITTYRSDEVKRHPALQSFLGNLATTRSVERLDLRLLSRDAVAMLARDCATDVGGLFRLTAGNPFFVTEVIANHPNGIPATVRDAVFGRVAQLGPSGRALLDLAAVIGARIEYDLLEQFPETAGTGLAECLSLGVILNTGSGVMFRHELVRTCVLEAIDPLRHRDLSRKVFAAASRMGFAEQGKTARLAHYAECAAVAAEVVRFGTLAGRTAASVGAHREAAAHFRSVMRFSEGCSPAERAVTLGDYSRECALIDDLTEAIDAGQKAVTLWGRIEDPRRQGEALAALAWPLVRNGANDKADAAAEAAVALLERFGPSAELANAYRTQAHLRMLDRDRDRAVEIGRKAIAMAEVTGDRIVLAGAEIVVGAAMLVSDDADGRAHLDRGLAVAMTEGRDDIVALARMNIGSSYGEQYHFSAADAELRAGIAFARDQDLDHAEQYMSSWLALVWMFQGRWTEAADLATKLLAKSNLALISRIMALVALGRVRARRGDPAAAALLDEALLLAKGTATLQRLAPVHAARAELAWFAGDMAQVRFEASAAFDLAARCRHAWHSGEFLYWQKLSGGTGPDCEWVAVPYARQIAGDWAGAATLWRDRGCPYEEARALADGDRDAKVRALEIFDQLGAGPSAALLRRDMRAAGDRHIPRGQRTSTRQNPHGLTNRELMILNSLVQGQSNGGIADALFISAKTVDHHVSSILGKLGVASRREAADTAVREGLIVKNGESGA